jgi:hypothetical protein
MSRSPSAKLGQPDDIATVAVFVSEFIDSMFPIAAKARGVMFDAFVSNADVNDCDLEAITVPTLVIHTKDDRLIYYDAAPRATGRVPGRGWSAWNRAATSSWARPRRSGTSLQASSPIASRPERGGRRPPRSPQMGIAAPPIS